MSSNVPSVTSSGGAGSVESAESRKHEARWILLLCVVASGPLSDDAAAQTAGGGPGFDETIDYISSKLDTCGYGQGFWEPQSLVHLADDGASSGRFEAVGYPGLFIDWGFDRDGTYGGKQWELDMLTAARVRFNLADLYRELKPPLQPTPAEGAGVQDFEFGVMPRLVTLRCVNRGCMELRDPEALEESWRTWGPWGSGFEGATVTHSINYGDSSFTFMVGCDEEEAGRLQRALSHLIALGGGQRELF